MGHLANWNHRVSARENPHARRFEWGATRFGYQTVYGDQDSFLDEGNDRYFATVELVKGWSRRALVRDANGRTLAGAVVLVDGEASGKTDTKGIFEVVRDEAPHSIEATHGGLRPATYFPDLERRASWHKIVLVQPG